MHKFFKLIMPSSAEVVLYVFGAFLILLALNAVSIWHEVLHVAQADPVTTHQIGEGLRGFLDRYTTLSDPQVVNAVVWALTGGLGFVLTVAAVAFIHTVQDDRAEPTFFERFGIRVLAAGALLLLLVITATTVLPYCSQVFVRAAVHMAASWYNVFEFFGVVLVLALCLYVAAVLCRLMALRLRVFSAVIE